MNARDGYVMRRMLCAQGRIPPEKPFAEALPLLSDTRADEWLRCCANILYTLVHSGLRAAYAFADAVPVS